MHIKTYASRLFLIMISLASATSFRAQDTPNQMVDDVPNPWQITREQLGQNNYITPLFDLKAR